MKYAELVPPPKLAVRRDTGAAMIENAKLFDKLIETGLLKPVDPKDPIPLYDVEEIKTAWMLYRASKL